MQDDDTSCHRAEGRIHSLNTVAKIMPVIRQISCASWSIMKLYVIAALFTLFAPSQQVRTMGIIYLLNKKKQNKCYKYNFLFFYFRHMKSVSAR